MKWKHIEHPIDITSVVLSIITSTFGAAHAIIFGLNDNAFDVCLSVFWMRVCVFVNYMLKSLFSARLESKFIWILCSRICETFQNGCGSKTKNIIATYIWLATFLILCWAIYNLALTFVLSSHSVALQPSNASMCCATDCRVP